jgi:hypothetical protein
MRDQAIETARPRRTVGRNAIASPMPSCRVPNPALISTGLLATKCAAPTIEEAIHGGFPCAIPARNVIEKSFENM